MYSKYIYLGGGYDLRARVSIRQHPSCAFADEFRYSTDQVEIFRRGNKIVLRERPRDALEIFNALSSLPIDFMEEGPEETHPQERVSL